jgi:hypothetical protein
MNNVKSLVGSMALVFSVSGCATDRSLSPPPSGEKVTFIIKTPEELKPSAMRVMYRSAKCQRVTHDAHGQPRRVDGKNLYEGRFELSGETGMYQTELFLNGGPKPTKFWKGRSIRRRRRSNCNFRSQQPSA